MMNLAKNMEAVFVAAVLVLCAGTYQSESVADPVDTSVVAQASAMSEGA